MRACRMLSGFVADDARTSGNLSTFAPTPWGLDKIEWSFLILYASVPSLAVMLRFLSAIREPM